MPQLDKESNLTRKFVCLYCCLKSSTYAVVAKPYTGVYTMVKEDGLIR